MALQSAFAKEASTRGQLTNELIYRELPGGVLDELRRKNPVEKDGRRRYKHHQFLTIDIGNPHLEKQVTAVTTLMRVSPTWPRFKRLFDKAFSRANQPRLPGMEDEDDGTEEF